jgi:hypothetical protein
MFHILKVRQQPFIFTAKERLFACFPPLISHCHILISLASVRKTCNSHPQRYKTVYRISDYFYSHLQSPAFFIPNIQKMQLIAYPALAALIASTHSASSLVERQDITGSIPSSCQSACTTPLNTLQVRIVFDDSALQIA